MSEPKKRLVFFDFVTHYGGAQRSTVYLLRCLRQWFDVRVIDPYGVCSDYRQALQQNELAVTTLKPDARACYIGGNGPGTRAAQLVRQLPELRRLGKKLVQTIDELQPDLILTNSYKALGLLSWCGMYRKGPAVVFYARGWYREDEVPWLARRLIRDAHCVLAVSRATAEALKQWGVPPSRVHVVHTVMDAESVIKDAEKPFDHTLPGNHAQVKILLPAQLIESKGQHVAVDAAAHLKTRDLDFVMWLCGDEKMGVSEIYRSQLIESIKRRGLENHVYLLGHRSDVLTLMAQANMMILPTRTEGFPRTVWEAMMLKCPVIATPAGGITDLIQHEHSGLFVDFDDGSALATAIERLIDDEALVQYFTEQAYRRVTEDYSPNQILSRVEHVLQKIEKRS